MDQLISDLSLLNNEINLNNFLIMRTWVAYATKIGDPSVSKVTNERINGPKEFNDLNREFDPKHITNKEI